MKLLQNKLFQLFVFVAMVSASKITWFGTYEPEAPKSLKKFKI